VNEGLCYDYVTCPGNSFIQDNVIDCRVGCPDASTE